MALAPTETVGIGPYIQRADERIERYFREVDREGDALVIGVFGEWGSGKSTLLNEIRKAVDQRWAPSQVQRESDVVTLTVDFNPWRYEREEHLLVPLLRTAEKRLSDFIDGRASWEQAQARLTESRWRKTWRAWAADSKPLRWIDARLSRESIDWLGDRLVMLGACTIALTKMVKLKASVPMLGEVELAPYEALKAAQEQIDRGHRTPVAHDQPQGHVSLYYDLFAQLRKLTRGEPEHAAAGGDTVSAGNKLNFLFLVDDLDRCLPDKAVEMLEAIKLFLDVAGCVFILALDDEVVERGIAHRYRDYLQLGDRGAESIAYSLKPERYAEFTSRISGARLPPITGSEYLEKIIQIPFRLPRWSRTEARSFLLQRFPALFPTAPDAASKESRLTPDAEWLLELFLEAVPIVPRKMVRAGELLEFVRGVAAAKNLNLNDYTLAQITLLQLFSPQCFRFLRRDRREAWITLEKRIYITLEKRTRRGPNEKAPPDYLSESFFQWWDGICKIDAGKNSAVRYIESIERPFIDELRQAAHNRTGFDPRRLFLVGRGMHADRVLGPYFSLFAEPQVSLVDLETRQVAAPVQRDAFIEFLLGLSPESWSQALSSEPNLRNAILDDATFNEIATRIQDRDPRFTADWLDALAPILSTAQLQRLIVQSGMIDSLWSAHRKPKERGDANDKPPIEQPDDMPVPQVVA